MAVFRPTDVASDKRTSDVDSVDEDVNSAKPHLSVPTQRRSQIHSNSFVCSLHLKLSGRLNEQSVGRCAHCLPRINTILHLGCPCVLLHVVQTSSADI